MRAKSTWAWWPGGVSKRTSKGLGPSFGLATKRFTAGKIPSELRSPTQDGLMTDNYSPGGQKIFDHAQAERKSEIKPDRMGYDLGGKPVAAIKGIPDLNHTAGIAREPTWVST